MPTVGLIAYPSHGRAPLAVGFIPKIHDPLEAKIVSYKWDFGDGRVATTPPLFTSIRYRKPGTYVASLTIVTADGRSARGVAVITVKSP